MPRNTPDIRLTPLQIDVVEFLAANEGELIHWDQIAAKFSFEDDRGRRVADHRLSEAVWGLLDSGVVFEPRERQQHYHLTDSGLRLAPQLIADRESAVKRETDADNRHRSKKIYDKDDAPTPTVVVEPVMSLPRSKPAGDAPAEGKTPRRRGR